MSFSFSLTSLLLLLLLLLHSIPELRNLIFYIAELAGECSAKCSLETTDTEMPIEIDHWLLLPLPLLLLSG